MANLLEVPVEIEGGSMKFNSNNEECVSNKCYSSPESMDGTTVDDQTHISVFDSIDSQLAIVPTEGVSQEEEPMDLTDRFTTDRIFQSREELIDWAKDTGIESGTVIVIKKSDYADSGRTPRIFLGCERGGKFRARNKHVTQKGKRRKSGTKLCGCPFMIRGVHIANSLDKWKVKVECGQHNHPLVSYFEGHSYVGRLTLEEHRVVKEMYRCGVKPKQALSIIKARNPSNASTLQHVYNARSNMRMTEVEGKSQMQQLMKSLSDNGYIEWSRRHEDTEIVGGLFWAHPESVQLAKCFPHVFLMDSAYKTNKFKCSLFEIVGVTSTMKTFSVCFALMEEEKDDNYLWALEKFHSLLDHDILPSVIVTNKELALINGLQKVFPSTKLLLCRWHILRNVMSGTKKEIHDPDYSKKFMDKWTDLMMAKTEHEYNIRLHELEHVFSVFPTILKYVKETWLDQYKECFVAAWTDLHMHFGNTTANRAEGSHWRLKKKLGTCKFDFLGLWKIMHPLLVCQITEINASFETSLSKIHYEHMVTAMKDVRGFVSRSAIDLMLAEQKRGEDIGLDAETCKCVLRSTHGLPCAHELTEYERKGHAVPLSSIHHFWKKLSPILNATNLDDLYSRPEFQLFLRYYNESSQERKVYLLTRLKELACSESSWLAYKEEVELESLPKGAKNMGDSQSDTSTEHNLSSSGHALTASEAIRSHTPCWQPSQMEESPKAPNDDEDYAKVTSASANNGGPTIFDKIMSKEFPSTIAYEDEKVLAFHDSNPQAPVHIVVIPKFRDGLTQLSKAQPRHSEILAHLLDTAKVVAKKEGIEEGFRVVINNGPDAGQSVNHLHLHVLGGRPMNWPPG